MPPDLILLDLMMPVMNGWEFRKRQTEDPALEAIPVVVGSANANIPQKDAALDAREYLTKPVDPDKLLEVVQRWIPVPAACGSAPHIGSRAFCNRVERWLQAEPPAKDDAGLRWALQAGGLAVQA